MLENAALRTCWRLEPEGLALACVESRFTGFCWQSADGAALAPALSLIHISTDGGKVHYGPIEDKYKEALVPHVVHPNQGFLVFVLDGAVVHLAAVGGVGVEIVQYAPGLSLIHI